jgi:branched-chain amino acid transport system ATP-binding protein
LGSVLEVKNVRMDFGNLHALDDVSFEVEERKVTILIGPNGSGKTTLINVASGFYKPKSGSIVYRGEDITGLAPHRVYAKGLVRTFQIPALFPKLAVLENVLVAKKGHPGEAFSKSVFRRTWQKAEERAAEEAFEILDAVGLLRMWDKPASNLSGGQMKLLEIARALMSGANTMLLDEPISGVNPTLAHEIFQKILSLRDRLGLTFLIVEHRLDIALSYVDTVVAMAYGKLLARGKPEAVMVDPKVIDAYLGG